MFGHRGQDKLGNQMPIQKKMGFASNAPELLKKLERKCSRDHPHGCLLCRRAKASAVYPPGLCQAIVEGFHAQMAADFEQFHKASGHFEDNRSAPIEVPLDLLEVAEDDSEDFGLWDDGDGPPPMMGEDPDTADENWGRDSDLPLMDFEDIAEVAWDDVKEVSLDLGKVKAARAIEMKFVRDRKIYKYARKMRVGG